LGLLASLTSFACVDMSHFKVVAAAIVVAAVVLIAGGKRVRSSPSEQIRGVPNFGRVTEMLYRGGQPTADGFSALRAMGVGLVINFRDEPSEVAREKREVESRGMKYIMIPWGGHDEPSDVQVVEFLDLVRTDPQTRIFVHCRRGADRTGVMIAAYRIVVEHESVSDAVSEMHKFRYDWLLLPQLERYVESLPALMREDPRFSEYNSYVSK
jgi:tyrosine-protein phosphatase SIW14